VLGSQQRVNCSGEWGTQQKNKIKNQEKAKKHIKKSLGFCSFFVYYLRKEEKQNEK
jgi:hypothetical protein